MEDIILGYLKKYKKASIPLGQLENLVGGSISYENFSLIIGELIERGILSPIKSHGTNGKFIPLHNSYRIGKSLLRERLNNEIQKYSLKLNSNISLEAYFSLTEGEWKKDLAYIRKIDSYLEEKGLPIDYTTRAERSFQLTGNEKWIDEEDGKRLLERIKLWDKLKIIGNPDPLMLAINPPKLNGQEHIHLVVENKTSFYALMDAINVTDFTSIVYGAGWRVVASMDRLASQLGLKDDLHRIYYFGDLDPEGINIWYQLNRKYDVELGLPFYRALLNKGYSIGKEGQEKNKLAIEKFISYFNKAERNMIEELIENKAYMPQEALKKDELVNIWRNSPWMFP